MRQLEYYVIERNEGEFVFYTDDRYYWLYSPPTLFSTYVEAKEVSDGTSWNNPMGGTIKKVTLVIED